MVLKSRTFINNTITHLFLVTNSHRRILSELSLSNSSPISWSWTSLISLSWIRISSDSNVKKSLIFSSLSDWTEAYNSPNFYSKDGYPAWNVFPAGPWTELVDGRFDLEPPALLFFNILYHQIWNIHYRLTKYIITL